MESTARDSSLFRLIPRAVALAMGVAVIVMSVIGTVTPDTAVILLGIGLAALGPGRAAGFLVGTHLTQEKSQMIQVETLSKRYGENTAVNEISFAVGQGEIFGLLGPNGAGKTTTMEILEGLRHADSGRVSVAGVDPARQPRQLRDLIGVQLQSGGLPEAITPDEAMRLFCAYHQVPPRTDLLERLGLMAQRATQYHQLSTGQQRRLNLALAVAHHPAVLFLDEPTAGLDVASRVELHRLTAELRRDGTTILLATHDMAEAEALCDRIAILLHGRLVAEGTPLEITATGDGLSKVSVRTAQGALQAQPNGIPAVEQRLVQGEYVVLFSRDIAQTVPAVIAAVQNTRGQLAGFARGTAVFGRPLPGIDCSLKQPDKETK